MPFGICGCAGTGTGPRLFLSFSPIGRRTAVKATGAGTFHVKSDFAFDKADRSKGFLANVSGLQRHYCR